MMAIDGVDVGVTGRLLTETLFPLSSPNLFVNTTSCAPHSSENIIIFYPMIVTSHFPRQRKCYVWFRLIPFSCHL